MPVNAVLQKRGPNNNWISYKKCECVLEAFGTAYTYAVVRIDGYVCMWKLSWIEKLNTKAMSYVEQIHYAFGSFESFRESA